MARLIPVCGCARWVHPRRRPDFALEEIQELVRTNAPECIVIPVFGFRYGSFAMIVNERGAYYDLPFNESASILAQQTILGNAILVAGHECDWG
ncbi:MAG: hypothetical protein WCJ35_26770 [Planctomycetota bacterium]